MFVAVSFLVPFLVTLVVGQSQSSEDASRQGKGVMFGWNMMEGARRSCVGLSGRPGVCMGQNECAEMNGKSVGKCFPFDSCCSVTPNSCGGYSGASTSYFQSPDKFQDVCAYKVNVRRNVCQIRIDFERFSLGQPTKSYNESAYTCERDEFTLLSNENTKSNLPVLCGENTGQHVYVPVHHQQTSSDSNSRQQQITLKFRLAARDEDDTGPEPYWKIKISQLECQTTSTNWWKIKDIARQVWDWEDEAKDTNAKSSKAYSLAPEGCLQYFTDKDGSFESFNYNKGTGHYLGNLNYAVCFKRNQDTCGIKYEAIKFQVAYNRKLTGSTDRDCDTAISKSELTTTTSPESTSVTGSTTTPAQTTTTTTTTATTTAQSTAKSTTQSATTTTQMVVPSTLRSELMRDARRRKWNADDGSNVHSDYLLIPDGFYSQRFFASKYCNRSLEYFDDIRVKTQGPLYVAFVSDEYSNPNEDVEKGYRIHYSLMDTGC